MSYNPNNPDAGITYEDVKRENGDGLEQFQTLIEFNSQIQRKSGNAQFSKGFRRLKVWLDLAYKNPPVFIGKNGEEYIIKSLNIPESDAKTYALAGLLVIFQVFGDGNHRTANKFFYSVTHRNLTKQQMDLINDVMNTRGNDFTQIMSNPHKIYEIVEILSSKYPSLRDNGAGAGANRYGGKRTKIKTKSRKTNKNKTRKNKKSYRARKSKPCWDPTIISPVFFGYSIKK